MQNFGKQTSYLCVFSSIEKVFVCQHTTLHCRGSQFCEVHTICVHHQQQTSNSCKKG